MSLPENSKKISFTVKIYLVTSVSYLITILSGVQIYHHNAQLMENVRAVTAIDEAHLSQIEGESSQLSGWVVFGLGSAIIGGQLLLMYVVSTIHNLLDKTLRGVARKLEGASNDVALVSTEVSRACASLADGASEQAAAIEETTSSLEELSSMANQNAQNVHAAKGRANDARLTAEAGAHEMQEMSQVMNSMQDAGHQLDRSMEEIKQSGSDISKIIKTIDEIAFQTNILALNAAVEAARAGEAGMGFAVVADEVRNLAKRSADAARETSTLIEDSISKSDQGVHMSQKVSSSLKQIIESSRLVDKRLQEIVGQVREVDSYMNQVTESSEQQSIGVQQISKAVLQMDKVTQASAGSSEEAASSASELSSQANVLRSSVQELLELVGGNNQREDDFQQPTPIQSAAPVERTASTSASKVHTPIQRPSSFKKAGASHGSPARPAIKLQSTRVPQETSPHSKPAIAPRLGDKDKSIPMDDFKDF